MSTETAPAQLEKPFAQVFFAPADAERQKTMAEATATPSAAAAPAPSPAPVATPPAAASPAEPATPAAAADPDAEIESGKRSPRSEDFKRVKEKLRTTEREAGEVKTKLSTYETELTELRKQPKHNAKLIEELTAECDRYKTIHDQVLLTQLPDFQKQYQEKIAQAVAPIKALAPDKADSIAEALQLPDGKHKKQILGELIADLDDWTKQEVVSAANKVRDIGLERDSKIAKSHETLNTLASERAAQAKAQSEALAQEFEKAAQAKLEHPLFKKRDGDENWNKGVEERMKLARHIYGGQLDPKERAEASFWASSGETLLNELTTSQKRIQELESTVTKLQGASPSLHGGMETKVAEGDPKRPFTSMMGKWVKEAGGG